MALKWQTQGAGLGCNNISNSLVCGAKFADLTERFFMSDFFKELLHASLKRLFHEETATRKQQMGRRGSGHHAHFESSSSPQHDRFKFEMQQDRIWLQRYEAEEGKELDFAAFCRMIRVAFCHTKPSRVRVIILAQCTGARDWGRAHRAGIE